MREWVHTGTRITVAVWVLMSGRAGNAAGQVISARVEGPPEAVVSGRPTSAGPTSATEAARPWIGGPSTCPQPSAVWTELRTLMPADRLEALFRPRAGSDAERVEIFDLGVPYRIIAAGRVREYRDEVRDCANRARVAAVFVALAIDLAEASSINAIADPASPARLVPSPALAASTEASGATAEAQAGRPAMVRVGLGATVDMGGNAGSRAADAGMALRLSVGRGRRTLAGGAAALAPVDVSVGGVRLRQVRIPVDCGARWLLSGSHKLQVHGELGVSASVLSERALDLTTSQTRTALEVGGRVALSASLATASRFAPFLAVHAQWIPFPPTVFALPRGEVGHTASWWLGVTMGASLDFP